jgi:hypothetical protein
VPYRFPTVSETVLALCSISFENDSIRGEQPVMEGVVHHTSTLTGTIDTGCSRLRLRILRRGGRLIRQLPATVNLDLRSIRCVDGHAIASHASSQALPQMNQATENRRFARPLQQRVAPLRQHNIAGSAILNRVASLVPRCCCWPAVLRRAFLSR